MEQKRFVDIERVKLPTSDIAKSNVYGFERGDHIVIQEKVDGANASIRYDKDNNCLVAFSRKKTLDQNNTLNGFYNYVLSLDVDKFITYHNYVFFGEWLVSHTIKYKQEAYKKFYFYDVFDLEKNQYLLQNEVRELANELGFTYVKTYYDGKFISWEHCKSFMEQESDISIGVQEGVVIKNDTKRNIKLYSPNNIRFETVLKLVNAQFSEIKKDNHIKKIEDPNHIKEREHCEEIVMKIVTKQRVHKEILKMIDEQLLPNQLSMQDMKTICKILPKRIYDDCMKEEREYVIEAGEMFGKMSSHKTIEFTKEIILGI